MITSNRTYDLQIEDTSGHSRFTLTGTVLADMDANDTLTLNVRSSAHGAAQMNVVYGGGETFLTIALLQ